ncbi:MAG TPA: hypothetical protein VHG27_10195 [Xanthobacteraceae bacterium]|nr:hypothetical protein [Xanthobacteraceae bacterium]
MTHQRKSRKRASASINPERLPAELHYIAADILILSPKAADLLRSAARQVERDLRGWRRGGPAAEPPSRRQPVLRLVQ